MRSALLPPYTNGKSELWSPIDHATDACVVADCLGATRLWLLHQLWMTQPQQATVQSRSLRFWMYAVHRIFCG